MSLPLLSLSGALLVLSLYVLKKNKDLSLKAALLEQRLCLYQKVDEDLLAKSEELSHLHREHSALKQKAEHQAQMLDEMGSSFKSLSFEALEKNSKAFFDMAKETFEKYRQGADSELEKRHKTILDAVAPVKEALGKIDIEMKQLEKERKGDHGSLREHLKLLIDSERHLRQETSSLVKALRAPIGRGMWGEMQLRRVVELAGMLSYCDFYEQVTRESDDGMLRPDLIVKLPGGRQVIVDAKVPLQSYLDAVGAADDDVKISLLKDHARQLRAHLTALSKKAYWEHFQPTPEFVVLFLPSEAFFSAALEHDPSLLEVGMEQRVIISTPTTLIALLRATAYGWKQESLSRHAEQVSLLGHELYKRLIDMGGHFSKMGRSLSSAVEAYNKTVGSLEARVLVSARKFKEMGAAPSHLEFEQIPLVEKSLRMLASEEMDSQVESEQPS